MEKDNINEGMIVLSLAGHDKGDVFIVLSRVNEDFVLIADGISRMLEKPKLKRMKHLRVLSTNQHIKNAKELTDVNIKKILKEFKRG